MCQPGQRILPTTEKVWRVGEEGIFFFVAAAKRLSFFETYIFKRCLACSERGTLQTRYQPWSTNRLSTL